MTSHRYRDLNDLYKMQELLVSVRPEEYFSNHPSPEGLRELLELKHIQHNTNLYFDGEELIAFGIIDKRYSNFYFELKDIKDKALFKNMLDWAENVLQRANPDAETIDTSCLEHDSIRWQLLINNNFAEQTIKTIKLERNLNILPKTPTLAKGFSIRQFKGESELEAFVTLHRAAHNTENMTIEERQSWLTHPEYDVELDLLAIAPNGSLAAYCFTQIEDSTGFTDPIATHPKYQRMGLARALINKAFQLLKERGIKTAALTTSSENQVALQVYKSLGFEITWSKAWFAKPLTQDDIKKKVNR